MVYPFLLLSLSIPLYVYTLPPDERLVREGIRPVKKHGEDVSLLNCLLLSRKNLFSRLALAL